ncbi:DUF5810 domain-containing protein [Halomicrobium salinisoli]|uniref:DUF5810 domain-containing protein n=1 Tax=Halomicrobium salinisoli TaxID=2878391 RepID=UPI001CF02B3D|nr:DUF5810 domain-containing protein [Halomicrobium salinisoli]
MGYACPVCEDPQADAEHLANHLAFTAMTGGGDHEEWLDERVPEWGEMGESELADVVVEYAEEEEFPQVFEESGVRDHDHGGGHQHGHDHGHGGAGGIDETAARARGSGEMDDDAQEILREAQRLTEEMREEAADADDAEGGDNDGAADGDGAADDRGEGETE